MSGLSRVIDLGVFVLALAVPAYFVLRVRRFGYLLGVLAMWGILTVGGTTFRWSAEETRVLLFRYNWLYTGWIVGAVWCAIVYGLKRFVLWLKRGKSRVGAKVGASVCLAAGTAIVILAVPGTLRCWAYYNLTKNPKMLAALKINPERIELPDTSADPYFSLGYAEVRLDPEQICKIERHGRVVSIYCNEWSAVFLIPWALSYEEFRQLSVETPALRYLAGEKSEGEIAKDYEELDAEPVAGRLMREMVGDRFSYQLRTLNVGPKSYGEVFFMDGRDFYEHGLLSLLKILQVGEGDQVEIFTTDEVNGVIYLREGYRARAEIYSKDAKIVQTIRVSCDDYSEGKEVLYELLASYRFTVEELPDEDELKQLIQSAVGGHERFVESEE